MLMKIFAIYDSKAAAYLQPLFFKSTPEAVRSFSEAANDPSSSFYRHAEDFTLFELGSFDHESGKVESLMVPHSVTTALESSVKHREYYAALSMDTKKEVA